MSEEGDGFRDLPGLLMIGGFALVFAVLCGLGYYGIVYSADLLNLKEQE